MVSAVDRKGGLRRARQPERELDRPLTELWQAMLPRKLARGRVKSVKDIP